LVDHDSTPVCRQSFQAELQAGAIAEMALVRFENSPMSVSRTERHVAHASAEHLFVCRQLEGRVCLEQYGREVLLMPGEMTLIDSRRPYSGKFFDGSRLLVLKVPRHLLENRIGQTGLLTARALKPVDAEIHLTSQLISMLPDYAGQLGSPADEIFKDKILDLIALCIGKAAAKRPRLSSARSFVAIKVRSAIVARLADPDLDASSVARATGVSVRYANAVLADEGTSIRGLIQSMRLERCRKALEDPLQTGRNVSEIAYSWGFSDMTHFGRKFRATYGLLPTECRRLAATH
jgi:AraC-like DNA-binding protein